MATMATSMLVGPLISIVENKARDYLARQYGMMAGMEEQLEILERKLPAVLDVIADAEDQGARRPGVAKWLEALKAVAYEANDALDKLKYRELRHEAKKNGHSSALGMDALRLFPHHNPIVFRYRMGKELRRIVRTVEDLIKEMNEFGFQHRRQANSTLQRTRQTSAIIDSKEIVGRETKVEEIVARLLQDRGDRKEIVVLPIVGMGGMGKTTFAQLIYNDAKVQEHFPLRMWVCVSDDFDVAGLAKKMIDQAIQNDCGLQKDDLHLVLQRLQNELTAKKYLLVLDDVWNRNADEWEKLKTCLLSGGAGSAVLTTTRDETVARIMRTVDANLLAPLADEYLQTIFRRRAFSSRVPETEEFVEIGKAIVKKCCGSPLAVKALGSVLSTKHDLKEWSAVLEKSTISDEGNGILPILKLSYDDLPLHMKQCFAFCAIFPKDHEIEVETLVQLWMANEFIPSDDSEGTNITVEARGKQFFEELAWRWFFQDVKQVPRKYEPEHGYCCRAICKIHDLMHDVALSVMGKECITVTMDQKRVPSLLNNVRYFFLSHAQSELVGFMDKKYKAFRTIIGDGTRLSSLPKDNSLRALSLPLPLPEFPIRPKYLEHLRYLDCCNTSIAALPESMSRLYHLQTLKFSNCRHLTCLPKSMEFMTSLRHLYTDGCGRLKSMPPGLERLTSLQTLTCFVAGDSSLCSSVRIIEKLNLSGLLELRHVENITEEDAERANLMAKKELTQLVLWWDKEDHSKQTEDHEKVLNALKPHCKLGSLKVESYKGTKFPTWMAKVDMQSLVQLDFIDCKQCERLPKLWQLPCLQVLLLKGMDSLRCVCSSDMAGDLIISAFPSLKELRLSRNKSLTAWWEMDGKEAEVPAFPLLEELRISFCPDLKSLPNLPALKELDIYEPEPHMCLLVGRYLTSLLNLSITVTNGSTISSSTSRSLEQNFANLVEGMENWNPAISLHRMRLEGCSFFFPSGQLQPALGFWKYFELLEDLSIVRCHALVYWPEDVFQKLVSLKILYIYECNKLTRSIRVAEPSASARNQFLPCLESLEIYSCKSLLEVFSLPSSLRSITIVDCPKLEYLSGHPSERENMEIRETDRLTSLDSLQGDLPSLKTIYLWSCESLTALPNWARGYSSLQRLTIQDCPGITSLPECLQQRLDSVQHKNVQHCLMHPDKPVSDEPRELRPKSGKCTFWRN